jgi:hypothetical protein
VQACAWRPLLRHLYAPLVLVHVPCLNVGSEAGWQRPGGGGAGGTQPGATRTHRQTGARPPRALWVAHGRARTADECHACEGKPHLPFGGVGQPSGGRGAPSSPCWRANGAGAAAKAAVHRQEAVRHGAVPQPQGNALKVYGDRCAWARNEREHSGGTLPRRLRPGTEGPKIRGHGVVGGGHASGRAQGRVRGACAGGNSPPPLERWHLPMWIRECGAASMQRSQMARLQFFDCLCNSRQKMVARPRPRNGAPAARPGCCRPCWPWESPSPIFSRGAGVRHAF